MSLDLYMFAGINGAGKSTLYSSRSISKIKTSKRANADEIARDNHWDWRDQKSNMRAMKIEVKRIHNFIKTKQSFNMETTLAASRKSYINILNEAKTQGFTTHLLYVGLDSADRAKKRVKARVSKGGHGIPDEVIEKRYPRSIKNLGRLAPEFDTVEISDNTKDFKVIYSRNKQKVLKLNQGVSWAQESIEADIQAARKRQNELVKRAALRRKERGLDR